MTLHELLRDHGALGLEKQDALGDYLDEHSWQLDLHAGTIDFGSGRLFPIQVVGTESKVTGTWLWSWANRSGQVPTSLQSLALRLRAFGESNGVSELVTPELAPGSFDPHILATVACGITGADAYYLGHHADGAVLLLIQSPILHALIKPSVLHMTTIFSSLISMWEIADHQAAFIAYARAKGCRLSQLGRRVEVTDPDGERLAADFDSLGRLAHMETGPLGGPVKPTM